jgi:hypothetical protein
MTVELLIVCVTQDDQDRVRDFYKRGINNLKKEGWAKKIRKKNLDQTV